MNDSKTFAQDFLDLEMGRTLSQSQVYSLEDRLVENPVDHSTRLQLIEYYRGQKDVSVETRFKHILWMIDRCPEIGAWRQRISMGLDDRYSHVHFSEAKELWLKQAKLHDHDSDVLGNAGLFLIERDFDLGDMLLSKAMDLDPLDDFWTEQISRFNFWKADLECDGDREHFASKAFVTGKAFLETYGREGARGNSAIRASGLELCARSAFWIRDFAAVKCYAEEHIALVSKWNRGRPKSSRSLLGLVSVEEGDLETAIVQLLWFEKESKPNEWDLELANEILKKGETNSVIDYLRICKKLGHWRHRQLNSWIAALTRGEQISLC